MAQNPFDLFKSSQPSKKGKEKQEEKAPPPPFPATRGGVSETVPSNEEVAKMLDQINQMKTALLAQYDKFCETTGLSREEIHNFFSNPDNFSPQKWEDVQKNRLILEQQIVSIFGQGAAKKNSNYQQKKMSKERKSKTLGARQKWIPM